METLEEVEGGAVARGDLVVVVVDLRGLGSGGGLLKGMARWEEWTDDGGEGERDRGLLQIGLGSGGGTMVCCCSVESSSSSVIDR